MGRKCTARAPVNIAVVKYWGKRDEALILPINSSLSVTLSMSDLCSTTTVEVVNGDDSMVLNDKAVELNKRVLRCLQALRALSSSPDSKLGVRIVSHNNFPTAAGLASSASGFACLVCALAKLWKVDQSAEELSVIARQGSGSACRSLLGGFVAWDMGRAVDGADSVARQVRPHTHWPQMRVLIAVVNAGRKDVASTAGMQLSVQTSELLKYRAEVCVEKHMAEMEDAIHKRDFAKFAHLTMLESNQFHATCLDTMPPIHYLNQTSHHIIRTVHAINSVAGSPIVAYTFDAGPNAVLFCLDADWRRLRGVMACMFCVEAEGGVKAVHEVGDDAVQAFVGDVLQACGGPAPSSCVLARFIETRAGEGAGAVVDCE